MPWIKQHQSLVICWLLIFISHLILAYFYNPFSQDTARDLVVVSQHFQQHQPIFIYGPKASVGNFYLPPAYYQIHYILSLLTGNHPYTMKWFTVLLESFTPIILYLILSLISMYNYYCKQTYYRERHIMRI